MELETPQGKLIVEGWVPSDKLREWSLSDGLGMFWHGDAERQKTALLALADRPVGNVVAARTKADPTIVGFLAIGPPSPQHRWGREPIPRLLELAGLEVAVNWRRLGVARSLFQVAFGSRAYDDAIVVAVMGAWDWDLAGTHMTVAAYRKVMRALGQPYGFKPYASDDPTVQSWSGDTLVARVGPNVSLDLFRRFQALLFQDEPRFDLLM